MLEWHYTTKLWNYACLVIKRATHTDLCFPEHTAHSGDTISLKVRHHGESLAPHHLVPGRHPHRPGAEGDGGRPDGGPGSRDGHPEHHRGEGGGQRRVQVPGENDVGTTFHAARLNIYGPPFVRAMRNVTAVSGEDSDHSMSVWGYPIKGNQVV
ncbi:down syndrome cell adhesion molecule-like protein Dscam2 [Caerostris extrusa]|uniref:Down syndrome cell adhesion molecule-like protein Dscam2 n=1 Tax=Caerostris extrusa TaxID=172846 RepID=A0AAV4UAL5_CAEEX|nr:down syndrome cell adhesion molecule-like protein Dscam2 [Caerostris extrusa]